MSHNTLKVGDVVYLRDYRKRRTLQRLSAEIVELLPDGYVRLATALDERVLWHCSTLMRLKRAGQHRILGQVQAWYLERAAEGPILWPRRAAERSSVKGLLSLGFLEAQGEQYVITQAGRDWLLVKAAFKARWTKD